MPLGLQTVLLPPWDVLPLGMLTHCSESPTGCYPGWGGPYGKTYGPCEASVCPGCASCWSARLKAKCRRHLCVTAAPACQVLLCLQEETWKTNRNPNSFLSSALRKGSYLKILCSVKIKYWRSLVLKLQVGVFMSERRGIQFPRKSVGEGTP